MTERDSKATDIMRYKRPGRLVVGLYVNGQKRRYNILEKQKRNSAHRAAAEEMQTTKSIPMKNRVFIVEVVVREGRAMAAAESCM